VRIEKNQSSRYPKLPSLEMLRVAQEVVQLRAPGGSPAETRPATRPTLDRWMDTLPQPWTAAMEATMFTAWVYDHLLPLAAAVKVAHPLMLREIAAAKKKKLRGCRQARRLSAVRFSPGVVHGPGRDPRTAANVAMPQSAGSSNDAMQEQDCSDADGGRCER